MSDTTKDAVPLSDAEIKACALMIKGICMTRPQEEWSSNIESRIRFMLSRSPAQVQAEAVRAPDIYVWFAEPKPVYGSDGERFIRAWTNDASKVDRLRKAIGHEPTRYRAAPSTGDQS
ncbi:hypothetical protein P0D71_00350 [Paraburkholderia sp. RL17-383-BIF-A]|uniref:hypothetical protein n=1 Tax=Paraburkholderia sp. RL17-383-BIF-A TaxID=3031631 RepID=UPI0038BC3B9C